jgi:TolA-binding protein
MKKIFALFLAVAIAFGAAARAQEIEPGDESAAAKLESKFVKLEESVAALTAKVEEAQFENRQAGKESAAAIRNISLSADELKAELAVVRKKFGVYDIEIENLKNTLAMMKENIAALERRANGEPKALAAPTAPDEAPAEDEAALLVAAPKPDPVPAPADAPAAQPAANAGQKADDESYAGGRKLLEARDFTGAAIAFADNIKAHAEGANYYNNLAGLGLAMEGLGKTADACKAFSTISAAKDGVGLEVQKIAADKSAELKCGA